jgi:NitT/TauT family transport system permease protein/taurine transport system permease protein
MIARVRALAHPAIPVVALLLLFWWVLPLVAHVPNYVVPSLASTSAAVIANLVNGRLINEAIASLGRYLLGVGVGSALGIFVGLLLASSRPVALFIQPLIEFVRAIAGIAWLPLAVIWLGFGNPPLVFVIVNIVFFILVANTMHGVESVAKILRDMARTLGASHLEIYRDVILPGALPSILVGMRLAVGFGWQAAIAGEVLYGQNGLGFMATDAGSRFDTETLMAALLAIGFLGLLIIQFAIPPLEAQTIERWGIVRPEGR